VLRLAVHLERLLDVRAHPADSSAWSGLMGVKENDIISLVLQGKQEYEALLKQNVSLKTKCHALEMQCERLTEQCKNWYTGMTI